MKNLLKGMTAISLIAAALTAGTLPVVAQEVRANPFLPNPTSEEERINAERERLRQAVREMMPEIKSLLATTFAEERTQTTAAATKAAVGEIMKSDDLKKLLEASKAPAAGPDGKGDPKKPGSFPGAAPAASENKFVGCFNGKGLYRDKNGISFMDASGELGGNCS